MGKRPPVCTSLKLSGSPGDAPRYQGRTPGLSRSARNIHSDPFDVGSRFPANKERCSQGLAENFMWRGTFDISLRDVSRTVFTTTGDVNATTVVSSRAGRRGVSRTCSRGAACASCRLSNPRPGRWRVRDAKQQIGTFKDAQPGHHEFRECGNCRAGPGGDRTRRSARFRTFASRSCGDLHAALTCPRSTM